MAAVSNMEQDLELVTELLQSLTNDVTALKKSVERLPHQAPPDYRTQLEQLSQAVEKVSQQVQKKPEPAPSPGVDLSPLGQRLDTLSDQIRQRPEYRLSRYVQYGGYAFGLMVVVLVVMTWLALDWRSERDQYQQAYTEANWRVRYTRQSNPDFYNYMEGIFSKEPTVFKWIVEQEQADEKRELARQAAEQAKAMNAQADALEGKTKGKKKGH